MSAPTATPRERFRRHWPGIAFVLLLMVIWLVIHSTKRVDTNWQRSTKRLADLSIHASDGMLINANTGRIEIGDEAGSIEWHEPTMEGVQFLQLQIRSSKETDWRACILQFIALNDPEPYYDRDNDIHHKSRRPRVTYRGESLFLTWILSRPVQSVKLNLPANSSFQIEQVDWAGISPADYSAASWLFVGKIVALGLELGLLALWLGRFFPRFHHQLLHGRSLAIVAIAAAGILMIFLLPPFQGPDENKHWKAAVQKFRPDGLPGYILHDLPDLLEATTPRWRSENSYPADALFSLTHRPHPPVEQESVGYAGPLAYPFIALISLVFPSVSSVSEALVFYYLCRILALACLCLLLGLVQKQLGISWLLMTFITLPLVMQQCIIVSTDTVLNLGTLAAFYFFVRMRSQQSWWMWAIMTFITLMVIAAKPPLYLMLLVLPGWFLPWRVLLRGWYLVALIGSVILVLFLGYFVLWNILERTDSELAVQARQQLRFVSTLEGLSTFLIGASDYPYKASNPLNWCTPLGWLDTDLNDHHLLLLGLSLAVAALLDLIRVCQRPRVPWVPWLADTPASHATGGMVNLSTGKPWHPRIRHWLLNWLVSLALIGIYFLFTWLSLALVMYLTISSYQQIGINGMQVRYLFPVILFALIFPRTIKKREGTAPAEPSGFKGGLLQLSQVLLITLLIARLIQLAIDLQYRYW